MPQIGEGTPSARSDDHARRQNPPDDDSVAVGVLEGAKQRAREDVHGRDRAWGTADRLVQAFPLDPVPDPPGQVAPLPDVVYVPDRGMVEPGQRLGLEHEPGLGRTGGGQVAADADLPLEQLVKSEEEGAVRRGGDLAFDPVARTDRRAHQVDQVSRAWGGHGPGRLSWRRRFG
jgi:hypothetical protein